MIGPVEIANRVAVFNSTNTNSRWPWWFSQLKPLHLKDANIKGGFLHNRAHLHNAVPIRQCVKSSPIIKGFAQGDSGLRKPVISPLFEIASNEYFSCAENMSGWRFSEILYVNHCSEPKLQVGSWRCSDSKCWNIPFGRHVKIWSLIQSRKILSAFQGLARETRLPDHNESVDSYQYGGCFRPSKLLFACGLILAPLGLVLLFKAVDKIELDARVNDNMAVCGFFIALATFVIGGLIVLMYIFP
ncbi:MAG: hypothetical protein ABSC60_14265 [Acidobacteriota bacterium]